MIRPLIYACLVVTMANQLFGQDQDFDFAHEVLPILKTHCAECHSDGNYQGGFSIDSRESILESGAVEAGDAVASDLIDRISSDEIDYRMPPEGERLSELEIAALKNWIDQNLPWESGFTFKSSSWVAPLKPRTVKLPPGDGNPIDRIVNQYFADNKTSWPNRLSDAAFARRASLDLVGLLPTPDELNAFTRSSNLRRENYINTLLGRDRDYADHWMSFWNDLLRNDYTGTGYIDGGRKQITRWLHDSLLANKPYDQFTRELINPSDGSAGFINGIKWRGRVNASQVQEVQFAQNVSQVFMGENLKCASCHDSFVDDWKLSDAYGMAAIIADQPIEMFRCDKPTGKMAKPQFLFPSLGEIDAGQNKEQRLSQVADLIVDRRNGRFTRTIVNRLWQRLMGRGLVEPVDVMGNQPWNEDILDFLAEDLAENEYNLKHTLRLIVSSRIYQSACVTQPEPIVGEYQFRGPLAKRMTAEQFIDAVWSITNTWPAQPNAGVAEPQAVPVRSSLVVSDLLMRSLGRPNRDQVVTTRDDVLSTLQALDLSNGEILFKQLESGADNLLALELSKRDLIERVFLHSLARKSTGREFEIIEQQLGDQPDRQAIADFLWTILMLPEFQHVQ